MKEKSGKLTRNAIFLIKNFGSPKKSCTFAPANEKVTRTKLDLFQIYQVANKFCKTYKMVP